MSYLETNGTRQRVQAAAGVGALHAVLGAGLLVGLAVQVAPDTVPEPVVVELVKPEQPVKVEPLPVPPDSLEQVTVVLDAPTFEVETEQPEITLPPIRDPLAGAGAQGAGGGTVVVEPTPAEPVRRAAVPRAGSVGVAPEDYPTASRRAGEAGRVSIRVRIGTDGRVDDCAVVRTSGFERLDARTCEVAVRRWRFAPATEDGVPVASSEVRSVLWRLEDAR